MRTELRSSTTTDLLPNPHPGEVLREEFLRPMALSQTALARAIGDKLKAIRPRAA
jgi:plasmid maintenance system antidote protein VapI